MRTLNDIFWFAGTPIFFVFMFVGIGGVLWFDMPTNSPFVWATHRLAMPICIVTWLYALSQRDYFRRIRRVSNCRFWFCSITIAPICILLSAGFVSIMNCTYTSPDSITVQGPIRELRSYSGRYGPFCSATIHDTMTSVDVTLDIPSSEFSRLAVGQVYRRDMSIGRLGIPFRKRA